MKRINDLNISRQLLLVPFLSTQIPPSWCCVTRTMTAHPSAVVVALGPHHSGHGPPDPFWAHRDIDGLHPNM
jgi:hypothetical protein